MIRITPTIVLSFLLATLPLTAFSEIDKSNLIKQSGVFQTDKASSASIYIGASDDGGVTTAREFIYSKVVSIEGLIEVDSDDVGKAGDIFVVMRKGSAGSKRFYALNESGVWESWGGSLKNLPIAKNVNSLSENEKIEVYSGKIELGQVIFYVGYSTNTENSKPVIHVNGSPQKFTLYDPCPSCLQVLSTSYGNDHLMQITPFHLPNKLTEIYGGHDWLSAVGQADFTQNGELELVTHSHHAAFSDGLLADGTEFQYGDKSEIRFWRRNQSGENWIEITDTLLKDNKGCMLARKALIADFNNDSKPDVFFSCTGHDRVDNVSSDSSDFSTINEDVIALVTEKPIVLLSQEDGTYEKEFAIDFEVYGHGASAGDLDGDGFVDVVISDAKKYLSEDCDSCNGGKKYTLESGKSLWFLWGKGDGTFDISDGKNILPSEVYNEPYKYWAIEVIDIDDDNKLDIWLGGSAEDWILYNDGNGDFKDRIKEVPKNDRYYESLDALKIGTDLYVYSINEDYSKPQYYWGDALTKVDLISFSSEIVYEHEGYYKSNGKCEFVACRPWAGDDYLDTWFPWITSEQQKIVPLDKAFQVILHPLE